MRFIVNTKQFEPDCLKELREEGRHYSDLKDNCRNETKEVLLHFQQNYCAYCEQEIGSIIQIEHYLPQGNQKFKHLELDINNFLGVCTGKKYLYPEKHKKDHIQHCDTSKGKIVIKINPKNQKHINELYYLNDGEIRSKIQEHNFDLSTTLNLNFDLLKRKRIETFKNYNKILTNLAKLKKLSKTDAYKIGLQDAQNGISEFSGYLIFKYKELLAINDIKI